MKEAAKSPRCRGEEQLYDDGQSQSLPLCEGVMGIIGSERQQPGWDKARE
jgi:hypothetical protein